MAQCKKWPPKLEMCRSGHLAPFWAGPAANAEILQFVAFKSSTGLMFQLPLAEHDKISNRACDDFQSWGATPVLKFGETEKLAYVVGNQSGWVGKLTKFLSIHLIYPLDPKQLVSILI